MKDLSLQELLQQLRQNDQHKEVIPKKKPIDNTVLRFIQELNISTGNNKIPTYYIFYLYKMQWAKFGRKVHKVEFFRQFSAEFKSHRNGKQRYYLLGGVEMLPDIKDKAKHYATLKEKNSHPIKTHKEIK